MRRVGTLLSGLAFLLLLAGPGAALAAEKENGKGKSLDPAGVERLRQNTGGKARVSISPATGAVRFVGIEPGERGDLMGSVSAPARDKASAFIREYAGIFGLRGSEARDCRSAKIGPTALGGRHVSYAQTYRGVPVFAGMLRAHFNSDGELTAVNGNVIPEIRVDPDPTRTASEAAAAAIAAVGDDNPGREIYARSGLLMVYRTGLARGSRRRELPDVPDRGRQRLGHPRVRLRRRSLGQGRRSAAGHHRRDVPPGLRRSVPSGRSAELSRLAVLGRRAGLPDRRRRSRQHDHRPPRRPTTSTTMPSAATRSTAPAGSWTRSSTAGTPARMPRGTVRSSRSATA